MLKTELEKIYKEESNGLQSFTCDGYKFEFYKTCPQCPKGKWRYQIIEILSDISVRGDVSIDSFYKDMPRFLNSLKESPLTSRGPGCLKS